MHRNIYKELFQFFLKVDLIMIITLVNVVESYGTIYEYEWSNSIIGEKLFNFKEYKKNPCVTRFKGKSLDKKVTAVIIVDSHDSDVSCASLTLTGEPKDVLPLLEQLIPTKEDYKKMRFKSPWHFQWGAIRSHFGHWSHSGKRTAIRDR